MKTLTDKCCPKCIDNEFQRCPKFTECLSKRPLAECHDDMECIAKRDAVIHKIRYGNGMLLKLSVCSYIAEEEIGRLTNAIFSELRKRDLSNVSVTVTGGLGDVQDAPFLSVAESNSPTIVYARVTEAMIPRIVGEHLEGHDVVEEWVLGQIADDSKKMLDGVPVIQYLDFFRSQNLRVLQRCGMLDPENLDEFFLDDGFQALSKALNRLKPDEVVNLIDISGLRGRGGANEYVIKKWMRMTPEDGEDAHDAKKIEKYLICNAHEGYDISIKDRNLLESDPFGLLEGMLVTAYAVQATQGIIYIHPSYRLAMKRLENALRIAHEHNYLGEEILGTDFSFDIEIRRAPSGYLSGEETAMIAFLEGEIGTRPVPPYVEESGLWGKPTLIHNVETFLHIAQLVQHDFSWFASTGMNENPGTKCLTVTGSVAMPGIIEIPLGTPVRDILFHVCGGELPEHPIKALHIGGPIGGYLPPEQFESSFDHDTLETLGLRMGTSTIEVLDSSVCLVDRVRKHFDTVSRELCGQCTAGREGIYQISAILDAICTRQEIPGGRPNNQDALLILREIADYVKQSSLCVYCEYAISCLLTSLHYFAKEYDDHVQKRCQAGVCF